MAYKNSLDDGKEILGKDTDETNRRYLKMLGTNMNRTGASLIMLRLVPDDFAHMIPEGEVSKNDILYGVTNYAIYVEVEAPGLVEYGDFGVLLNGSKVHTIGANYCSGGYVLQFNSHGNGFLLPYFGYPNENRYEFLDPYIWGARPMYFYDAAKEGFPAPRNISFNGGTEDFSKNAGTEGAKDLWYRLPFSAPSRDYINQITGDNIFTANQEGRNGRADRANNSDYGIMYGMRPPRYNTPWRSHYSPKHMQSWHIDPPPSSTQQTQTANKPANRIGFCWDGSWHLYNTGTGGQRVLWTQRRIFKLTVLEVTRDIMASEIEADWIAGGAVEDSTNIVHKAGDMFVRAEMIHRKDNTKDWNDSQYYVYSKPIWFGKFKGDAWRGDYSSPFKKLGNTMQHIVADPEPPYGDPQSFRRRGMRVRSWKEAFLGWDFSKVKQDADGRYRHLWKDFVNEKRSVDYPPDINPSDGPFDVTDGVVKFPPDFHKTQYVGSMVSSAFKGTYRISDSIWTPPIAINMNNGATIQAGSVLNNTFGQYSYNGQSVGRNTNNVYNGNYTDRIYGRLSILRNQGNSTPIFGLYAMRGWDYGTSENTTTTQNPGYYSYGGVWNPPTTTTTTDVYDSTDDTAKRFLMVVQGLQLPFQPSFATARQPNNRDYKADRDRIFGFHFWTTWTSTTEPAIKFYDTWIGEGFSPREVRAILGLRERNAGEDEDEYKAFIRGTYVGEEGSDGLTPLEAQGFYMPESYVPGTNP
jgi:hypothetical protein